jgi:hypothetical protein
MMGDKKEIEYIDKQLANVEELKKRQEALGHTWPGYAYFKNYWLVRRMEITTKIGVKRAK